LAALRHLFDWLVTGQVMSANPAQSVLHARASAATAGDPGACVAKDAASATILGDELTFTHSRVKNYTISFSPRAATGIAHVLFYVFLVIFLAVLIMNVMGRSGGPGPLGGFGRLAKAFGDTSLPVCIRLLLMSPSSRRRLLKGGRDKKYRSNACNHRVNKGRWRKPPDRQF
jgi:hypothetical protein